jgi:hypothetical protein
MAAQLAMSREDIREILIVYSLLNRGFELLDEDPLVAFEEVAVIATFPIGEYTLEFAHRDASDRSISAMKYVEGTDEQGFRFARLVA